MPNALRPDKIAICIPIRNEEALLPALLASLSGQVLDNEIEVTLCLLLDDCRDGSEAIIAEYARQAPFPVHYVKTIAVSNANAGRARRSAMEMGQAATEGYENAVLLTTDADSVPALDWVMSAWRALATCDVLAGRIVRHAEPENLAQDRLEAYYERLYALRRLCDPVAWEPQPAHHHVGGANLAFRATAYAALGGFETLSSGEDAAIIDNAHRHGFRVRRDRNVVVYTSGRHEGRAANGLADHLQQLARDETAIRVGFPDDAVWQFRRHALARAGFDMLHQRGAAAQLADALNVDVGHVLRVAAQARNAEAFATCVVPAAPHAHRLMALADAEMALMSLERSLFEHAA